MIDNKPTNRSPWDLVINQQEVVLGLMNSTVSAYMNFLRIPFSLYQMEMNTAKVAEEQAREIAKQATQAAREAATQQVKQMTELAALQATEAATQQVRQIAEQATLLAMEAATQQVRLVAGDIAQQATLAATEQVKQVTMYATLQATEAATQQVRQLAEQVTQQAIDAAFLQLKQFSEQAALQVAEAAGNSTNLSQEQAQLWSFEQQLPEAEDFLPLLIEVHAPGIVHAGVNQDGKWIRTYDVPLEEVEPGTWQAFLMDPDINEFTFIWYDPVLPGKVQWEGQNYQMPRRARQSDSIPESDIAQGIDITPDTTLM